MKIMLTALEKICRHNELDHMNRLYAEGLTSYADEIKKAYDGGTCGKCGKEYKKRVSQFKERGEVTFETYTYYPSCNCFPWCKNCMAWPVYELASGMIKIVRSEVGLVQGECPDCKKLAFWSDGGKWIAKSEQALEQERLDRWEASRQKDETQKKNDKWVKNGKKQAG